MISKVKPLSGQRWRLKLEDEGFLLVEIAGWDESESYWMAKCLDHFGAGWRIGQVDHVSINCTNCSDEWEYLEGQEAPL